ncbi:MAG: hypothetical protein ACI8R4_000848 [Paracoccaceae bacterium]
MSEGWWNIAAGDCKTPIRGDLKNRYYYYMTKSKGWNFWDEKFRFCTTSDAFTITGDEDCAGRGYDSNHFRKIDTGKTGKRRTQFLAAFSTRVTPAPTPMMAAIPVWNIRAFRTGAIGSKARGLTFMHANRNPASIFAMLLTPLTSYQWY